MPAKRRRPDQLLDAACQFQFSIGDAFIFTVITGLYLALGSFNSLLEMQNKRKNEVANLPPGFQFSIGDALSVS